MAIEAYPLTWPAGWKRTAPSQRKYGQFNKKEQQSGSSYMRTKNLTINDGVARIFETLGRMGISRNGLIISTNVRTRLDGTPRSDQREPSDPGVAVYWRKSGQAEMQCMAIDQYTVVADNLAAVAATLEAMRAIERHGGAEVLDRAFTGFKALPSTTEGPSWWGVLQVEADATVDQIQEALKRLARVAHPDAATGSHDAFTALQRAREQGLAVRGG